MELLPVLGAAFLVIHVALHHQLSIPHSAHRDVAALREVLHVNNDLDKCTNSLITVRVASSVM